MNGKVTKFVAALAVTLLAIVLAGCGSGKKEGTTSTGSALFGNVATVGDTACKQCHSANTEALTGQTLVNQYDSNSPHNSSGVGCEMCHGGGAMHNGVGPIPYPLAGLTPTQMADRCATCHTGSTAVKFTNTFGNMTSIVPNATNSPEFASSNHATGTPAHTSGFCIRCHTHEGAVLSDLSGFTGDSTILSNAAYGPPVVTTGFSQFNCDTCHQHGGGLRGVSARDAATNGNVVLWDPSQSRQTSQFDLCTSCHNLYNYNQTAVIGSGTAASNTLTFVGSGPHNANWYRTIVSTHKEKTMATKLRNGVPLLNLPFANMTSAADASNTWITGYVIRLNKPATSITSGGVTTTYNTDPDYKGPCFDCHGHEAKTETNPNSTEETIYKDWAESHHAGTLLTAKFAAYTSAGSTNSAAVTDSVTQAFVDTNNSVWSHYNWDDTSTRGDCQACHTATGISNYLLTQTTAVDQDGNLIGYDPTKNNFSHLASWSQTGGSKRQNELLYCWGCHKDAGTGALRNTSQAIFTFTYQNQAIVVTNAGNSTVCVICHGGRGSAGEEAANDNRSSRLVGHHAPTAGVLYSEKTHIGYEYAGQNYANPSFFEHDIIGQNADGPCASCHMGPASNGKPSHTFEPVITDASGTITEITNQALCNECHTGTRAITPAVLEEESAGYSQATTILNNWVGNVTGYTNYLNLAISSSNINTKDANGNFIVPNNAYGAFQNGMFYANEPCAYVHNDFYIKRLIFDSIDWMDDGVLEGTISIDATTYPEAAVWYGAPTGTTGAFTASRP
jgi:hypothetical protein